MKLGDLTPDPHNRRTHPPRNLDMLAASLREVGAARSIVIDETGAILAGHGTVEAASAAGLDRVHVVDADGQTVVAVRRTGLSAAQKRALALYDNRTAELAEWDWSQLSADRADGLALAPFFTDDELDAALTLPDAASWGDGVAGLPTTDRAGFQQIAFMVSDAQAEVVKAALARAKARGDFGDTGNANSNGNALARICGEFA